MLGRIKKWLHIQPEKIEDEDTDLDTATENNMSVLYGIESYSDLKLANEVLRRKRLNESLDDLSWGRSKDPFHPANNPLHPLYIPSKRGKN